jgi:hypothetical protein
MEQPATPPGVRLMAAGMLLDRGHGKAAQLVDVQGEVKQIVAVELTVVTSDRTPVPIAYLESEKPNDINGQHVTNSNMLAPPAAEPK